MILLCIPVVLILALLFLLPDSEPEVESLSHYNGFYQISFAEGYDFNEEGNNGCDYTYKSINLHNGDVLLQAKALSKVVCDFCGRYDIIDLPSEDSRVILDIDSEGKGQILFEGSGTDIIDFSIVK